jgi:excisionase family DNA binding protein
MKGKTMKQSTYSSELPPMMNLTQVADVLDVSVTTVRNWIQDGTLPAYRLGPRLIRVMVSDLTALISVLDKREAIEVEV